MIANAHRNRLDGGISRVSLSACRLSQASALTPLLTLLSSKVVRFLLGIKIIPPAPAGEPFPQMCYAQRAHEDVERVATAPSIRLAAVSCSNGRPRRL